MILSSKMVPFFPNFPGWSKKKEKQAEYVALFPNVMLGIHKDHYYAYWLEPISHEYTKEHMEIYYVVKMQHYQKNTNFSVNKILNNGIVFNLKM